MTAVGYRLALVLRDGAQSVEEHIHIDRHREVVDSP